jgi:superfamily I DNA and/or RNA helicase
MQALRCREQLAAIPFTAVMVEEAAEIVEPHVLASLPPTAERLIMIGDHQQLRPKVQSYNLQVRFCSVPLSLHSNMIHD